MFFCLIRLAKHEYSHFGFFPSSSPACAPGEQHPSGCGMLRRDAIPRERLPVPTVPTQESSRGRFLVLPTAFKRLRLKAEVWQLSVCSGQLPEPTELERVVPAELREEQMFFSVHRIHKESKKGI